MASWFRPTAGCFIGPSLGIIVIELRRASPQTISGRKQAFTQTADCLLMFMSVHVGVPHWLAHGRHFAPPSTVSPEKRSAGTAGSHSGENHELRHHVCCLSRQRCEGVGRRAVGSDGDMLRGDRNAPNHALCTFNAAVIMQLFANALSSFSY
ncbi:hypothetical protein EYF80_041282 [Liparis tanakae]|uniref:Uncharacterized protein n=1 Tax=Liparis tanakae TaxID=230148 RepID=A0A4Z2G4S4_9TELE|nr:hypothetical protein EYF80_041282 [Liparis tanakae]